MLFVNFIQTFDASFCCEKSAWTSEFKTNPWNFYKVPWRPFSPKERNWRGSFSSWQLIPTSLLPALANFTNSLFRRYFRYCNHYMTSYFSIILSSTPCSRRIFSISKNISLSANIILSLAVWISFIILFINTMFESEEFHYIS